MGYPNRTRLKMLGHTPVEEADANPDLAAELAIEGQGKVKRLFTIEVEAFDWICLHFITPRFTEADLSASLTPMVEELQNLRQENAFLK